LIESLNFLQDLENDCTWGIVRNLKKIRFEKGDKIYQDKELSETMFLIHKGTVKLYAENGYPFIQFKNGQHFGDVDLFCGIRRNGTAQTTEECLLYKI
jgi:signal-transduction protein with cAMP-binding, CBS, and nucleotidyltransferase domain